MKGRIRQLHITVLAGLLLIGLITMATSCKTPPKPPDAPAAAEATTESNPVETMPQETVEEAPIKPVTEPVETSADIDSTIRQQNSTRGILKSVHFEFDNSEIRDEDVPILNANAAWLRAHPQYKVLVEGHCDERDTIDYNLHLGERRAASVVSYLIELGVPASQMRPISYGKEKPIDPGHAEEAWAKNRRVEFTLEK